MPAKVAMFMAAGNGLGPHEPSAPLLGHWRIERAPRRGAKLRVAVTREECRHRAFRAVERNNIVARVDIPPAVSRRPEREAAEHVGRDPQPFCRIGGDGAGQFPGQIGHATVDIPADHMDQRVALHGRPAIRDKGPVQREGQRGEMRGQYRAGVRLKRKIGLQNIVGRPSLGKYTLRLLPQVASRKMVKERRKPGTPDASIRRPKLAQDTLPHTAGR